MKKNIVAVSVLIVLAAAAWFLVRETPQEKVAPLRQAIAPVDVGRVDGLKIVRHEGSGSTLREERIVLKKNGDEWRIVEPVDYPAHRELVELMLEELGNLHVIDEITKDKKKHHVLEVDDEFGVEVTASAGGKALLNFIVGVSNKNFTFVRLPGSDAVYRTVGAFRNRFNKSAGSLRSKRVTELDKGSVTRVKYSGEKGEIEMVRKGEGENAEFSPTGLEIEDIEYFDNNRALGNANALTTLMTKGYVDEPLPADVMGLDESATKVEFDAKKDGEPGTFEILIGKDDEKRRQTYVKTSLTDQIYLISTHIIQRFRIGPADFTVTKEEVDERQKAEEAAKTHAKMHHHN